jgi:hypothetical protein
MLMETTPVFKNRIGRPVRRGVGLLLASCFFLGVVALAMHHHDVSFRLKSCAICNAKTSFSGTFNKIKADLPAGTTATASLCPEALYFTDSSIKTDSPMPFIAPLLTDAFSNRAPPAVS